MICGELWFEANFRVLNFSEWFDWKDVDVSSLSGIRSVITTSWGVYVGVLAPERLNPKYAMINANDVLWTVHDSFTGAITALCAEAGRPNLLRFPYYVTRRTYSKVAKLRLDPAFADSFVEVCHRSFPDWLVFQEASYLGVHSRFIPPSRRFVGVVRTDSTLSDAKLASYHHTLKDTPHIVEIIDQFSKLGVVTDSQEDVFEGGLSITFDNENLTMEDLEELQSFLRVVVGGDIETSGLKQFFDSL